MLPDVSLKAKMMPQWGQIEPRWSDESGKRQNWLPKGLHLASRTSNAWRISHLSEAHRYEVIPNVRSWAKTMPKYKEKTTEINGNGAEMTV